MACFNLQEVEVMKILNDDRGVTLIEFMIGLVAVAVIATIVLDILLPKIRALDEVMSGGIRRLGGSGT
ncbi:MAG: hypothetical protein A4E53_00119 [Pelotomaculum sp. PtaB.Bin104]|nr:MAG: hypothetical protein A4E53_00119 [Pelotomaculum sp. PtaB.Bin104]